MNCRKILAALLLAPLITLGHGMMQTAHGSGYAVFTQGATALGQGNAVTAHTDGPYSIFYNPALITKLEGTQLEIGTTAIFSWHEFDSQRFPGQTTTDHETSFPSTFYVTHKFNDSFSAGLGVFNPFGLTTDWNNNWEGRALATKSELTTFNFNPVLAYRVLPSLSLAAGIDVILLDATLERRLPAGSLGGGLPATETGVKFNGNGTGVGYNVALAWDITDKVTLGASYRSEVQVGIDGKASTSPTMLVPVPGVGIVAPLDSYGTTSVRLPRQITAALAWQVSDPLVVEAGMRWEGWTAFQDLKITLDNGTTVTTERKWHNTWGMNVGGKYRLTKSVGLMGGYVFGANAVPNATFDPSIPDSDTHVFCIGTDYTYKQMKLALSYAYQLYLDRTKNTIDGIANGEYKSDAHLLALSLGYQF
ncbi:OmpP1/FadL family transporter [Geomonas sp.]|uniref:OmpP1/FadL family transporter n=1 Tax=Geomonas sp. TaxID=2651584 RepID=UPI002B46C803|nr:outer membrane protein transport protein [Geomonas sp.]HJV35387.1 outer membrane protein transport protein [Geomonas sp.]